MRPPATPSCREQNTTARLRMAPGAFRWLRAIRWSAAMNSRVPAADPAARRKGEGGLFTEDGKRKECGTLPPPSCLRRPANPMAYALGTREMLHVTGTRACLLYAKPGIHATVSAQKVNPADGHGRPCPGIVSAPAPPRPAVCRPARHRSNSVPVLFSLLFLKNQKIVPCPPVPADQGTSRFQTLHPVQI